MAVSNFPNKGVGGSRLDMKTLTGRPSIFVAPPPSGLMANLKGGWAARSVTPDTPVDVGEKTASPVLFLDGQGTLESNASAAPKWTNRLTNPNFGQDGIFGPFINNKMLKFHGVAGNYVSIPDHAVLDITDNIDIRALVAADGWQSSQLASAQGIVVKGGAYGLWLNTQGAAGYLSFQLNATSALSTAKVPFADCEPGWIRVTFAAGVVTFYWASLDVNSPSRQGETNNWIQLGTPVALAGPIAATTDPLLIGSRTTAAGPFQGFVYRALVYNAIIADWTSAAATTARVIDILNATTTPFGFTAGLTSWTESQQGQGTVTFTVVRAGTAATQTETFSRTQFDATFSQLGALRWHQYKTLPARVNMNPGSKGESFVAFIRLDMSALPASRGRYPLIAQKPGQLGGAAGGAGWGIWFDSGASKIVYAAYNDAGGDGTSDAYNLTVAATNDIVFVLTVTSNGFNTATIRIHTVTAAGTVTSSANVTFADMGDLFGDGLNAPLVSVLDPNIGGIYAAGMLRLSYENGSDPALVGYVNQLARGTAPVYAVGDWWAVGEGTDTSLIGPVEAGGAVVVTAVDGSNVPTLEAIPAGQKTWVSPGFRNVNGIQGAGITPVPGVGDTLLADIDDDVFFWGVQQFDNIDTVNLGYRTVVYGYGTASTYFEMSLTHSAGNIFLYAEIDTEDGNYVDLFQSLGTEAAFAADFLDTPFFWSFRFDRATQTLTANFGQHQVSVVASIPLLGQVLVAPDSFGLMAEWNGWIPTIAYGGGVDRKAPSDTQLASFKTQVMARYGLA